MIFSGITAMHLNNSGMTAAYLGTTKVWPTAIDYSTMYLTFDILSGGTIIWKESGSTLNRTISYSINNGAWNDINSSNPTSFSVNAGDKIRWKGQNETYSLSNDNFCYFSGSTAYFNVYGNIMSMIYGDNFIGQTVLHSGRTFNNFFSRTYTVNADNLVLPALTPLDRMYRHLFSYCPVIESAEFELPIMDLTSGATAIYGVMFYKSSIKRGPDLPATALSVSCYSDMYHGCPNLEKVPVLPATTLQQQCYYAMFKDCKLIEKAPDLPAEILATGCYQYMFSGCTHLNYIKCLAHPFNATQQRYWVSGVASSGTFVKSPALTSWITGQNGIPNGWTVVDAT